MILRSARLSGWLIAVGLLLCSSAFAATSPKYQILIKSSQFQPAELQLPAGQKIKVTVKNAGSAPAEFESYDLNIEKVVPGHTQTTVYVGPLSAGTYHFFNDFHQSAKGKFVVK